MKKLLKLLAIPAAIGILGAILNILVSRVNGGMPAKVQYATNPKEVYDILNLPYPKHTALYEGTQLKVLTDIINVGPLGFSIGDILIYGGLIACIVIVVIYFRKKSKTASNYPHSIQTHP